jgi:hypothetical protein
LRSALTIVVTLLLANHLAAQSLAEMAAKEKKRREASRAKSESAKVYTEDDLATGRSKSPSPTPEPEDASVARGSTDRRSGDRSEQADPPSEADRRRAAALSQLRAKFDLMINQGNALIRMAQTYFQTNCATGEGTQAQCSSMRIQVGSLACSVGTTLDEVEEIARRGMLPPGVVRKAREESGLDAPLWNQVQKLSRDYCRPR